MVTSDFWRAKLALTWPISTWIALRKLAKLWLSHWNTLRNTFLLLVVLWFSAISLLNSVIFLQIIQKKLAKYFSFLMSKRYNNRNVIWCDVAVWNQSSRKLIPASSSPGKRFYPPLHSPADVLMSEPFRDLNGEIITVLFFLPTSFISLFLSNETKRIAEKKKIWRKAKVNHVWYPCCTHQRF